MNIVLQLYVVIVWDWWIDTIIFQRECFDRHNLTLTSWSAKHILGPVFTWWQWSITLHEYAYYAQQCIPYAMALQCPQTRNLTPRADYIDLKTNKQFDVYSLDVICETFAGNMS